MIEEQWTLNRYYSMHDHWQQYGPPVYISVAAYLKLTKPKPKKAAEGGTGNLAELAQMFAGTGGRISG